MSVVGNAKLFARMHSGLKGVLAEKSTFRSISTSKSLFEKKETVKVTFVRFGKKTTVDARVGRHLLNAVKEGGLDIDVFGTCGGTMKCDSCHCMLQKNIFDSQPPINVYEEDRLDGIPDRADLSRLGCQVVVTEAMDGMEVTIPDYIEDRRAFVPEDED